MISKKATFTFGLSILVIVAVGIYTAVLPVIVSRQYKDRVISAVHPLASDFRALDDSLNLPLMTDPEASAATKANNASRISQLVGTVRQKLASVKAADGSLTYMPYSNILGQYRPAEVLHEHTQRFLGQTESAIDDYMALATYLEAFNKTTDNVTSELNSFNKATDLNIYGGQSERMRQTAITIRKDADQLSKVPKPGDVVALNTAAIAAFNDAADGFDDLAVALAIPADDPIYAATHKIERATSELDKVTGTMYSNSLNQSRTVKDLQDFSEKLDLVLET